MKHQTKSPAKRACCSTLEQLCLNRKMFAERERQTPVGWKISQVEKLVGLPRRDVQRACYGGKGGVSILAPKNGSWGQRTYTEEDLATLFLVAELKREGLSLPEIKRELENAAPKKAEVAKATSEAEATGEALGSAEATGKAKTTSEAKTASLLSLHEWRLTERSEALCGRLLRAKCLRALLDKGDVQEVRWLVWRTIEYSLAENLDALAQPRMRLAHMFFETCEDIANCMANGSESKAASAKMNDFLSAMESNAWPRSCIRQDFAYALEAPGVDLAIELWLGPGSFESVQEAFGAIQEANHALEAQAKPTSQTYKLGLQSHTCKPSSTRLQSRTSKPYFESQPDSKKEAK